MKLLTWIYALVLHYIPWLHQIYAEEMWDIETSWSLSSSCCTARMDPPGPLSPPISIFHCFGCCILICKQNHNNDTIKTSDTVLRKIYLSFYLKGLCVRGSWRLNRTATYWPTLLWPSAFLSRSPWLLNWGPGSPVYLGHVPQSSIFSLTGLISKLINRVSEGSLCWVLAFSTASCLQLVRSPN